MEITTIHAQQTAITKPVSAQDQQKVAMPDRDSRGEKKGAQVADDTVSLSKDGLKLAKTPVSQSSSAVPEIENSEQARQVVDQAAADIRTQRGNIESVYGNMSQLNVKSLFE